MPCALLPEEAINGLGLPTSLGGGLVNALRALASLRGAGLALGLTALAALRPSPALERPLAQMGVSALFLGGAELAENFVFSVDESDDRALLRDKVGPSPAGGPAIPARAWRNVGLVLLNSVKAPWLFTELASAALERRVRQVVAVTGSPSMPLLVEACRQDNTAAVFGNWAEWCALLANLGHPHELAGRAETALKPDDLRGLPGLARHLGLRGDVVCTLGSLGLVIGDEKAGTVWWVTLGDGQLWEQVQERLRRRPEARNGMGDRLMASWAAGRGPGPDAEGRPAGVAAAMRATRDALELAGLLPPSRGTEGVVAVLLAGQV